MAQEPCGETLDISSPEPSSSTEQSRIAVENGERSSPESVSSDQSMGRNISISKLSAQAPEFVPRSPVVHSGSNASPFWANSPVQISPRMMIPTMHVYPPAISQNSLLHSFHQHQGHFQYASFVEHQQEAVHPVPESDSTSSKDVLTEELTQKIVKQNPHSRFCLNKNRCFSRTSADAEESMVENINDDDDAVKDFVGEGLDSGFLGFQISVARMLLTMLLLFLSPLWVAVLVGVLAGGVDLEAKMGKFQQSQDKESGNLDCFLVEYYFSDANLATTDHLMRFISKDPEGFVPISVIASFKKMKAFISSHNLLATALSTSSKLVVSEDGKKVRRQHPFTDSDMEDLQSRTIVAENLPEDHSHQNLEKIFHAVGSVKTIRICHPQTPNGGVSAQSRSPKIAMLVSNKLHALIEYETVEQAEKAVSELNDERNWRSGLRVRLLLRRMPKSTSQVRARKAGHEGENGDEDMFMSEQADDPSQPAEQSHDHTGEESLNDKEGGSRKARGRGRGKARGRGQQHHTSRGGHVVGTPPASNSLIQNDQLSIMRQPPGPRMPDGTRGFTMGRGKPLGAVTA